MWHFKCIPLTKIYRILIQIWLKFVPDGPIDKPSLFVHMMANRWQNIIWINDDLIYCNVYASLDLHESNRMCTTT